MAAMTGGTAAPTTHGSPVRAAAEQRFLNRGNGKMETAKQMAVTRAAHHAQGTAPAGHHNVPAGHTVSSTHSTTKTVTTRGGGGPQLPSWINMNPGQLRTFAANLVAKEVKAGRVPFQEAGKQIGTEEGASKAAYGAAAQHGAEAQAQLVAQGENSAKTARNTAADILAKGEQAAKEQKGITPEGQATTPVQQEQEARAAAAAKAIGLSAEQTTNERAGAQEAFQHELQQNQQLASQSASNTMLQGFAKRRAENQAGENALVAKQPAQAQSAYQNLLGEQAKIRTAREANNLKVETIRSGERKSVRQTRASERNAALSAGTSRENAKEAAETQRRGQDLTRASAQERVKATEEHNAIYAQIQRETANGTKPNPAAGRKYMSLVDSAYGYVQALRKEGKNAAQIRQAMVKGEGTNKEEGGVTFNPDITDAAIHLAKYGRFSSTDKSTAEHYGLTRKMRPDWWQEAPGYKNGKPLKGGLNGIKGQHK